MSTHKFRMIKNVMSIALTLVLGAGVVGCASGGSSQGAAGNEGDLHISLAVIGPDENGEPEYYAPSMDSVITPGADDAWGLTQTLFEMGGLEYDASNSDYGIMLNSITSPVDGSVLAWDEATGCYWQLFVNGTPSDVGISQVELEDGMEIVWYYSAFGDALPESLDTLPLAA